MLIKVLTKQQLNIRKLLARLVQYSPCYNRYTLSDPEETGILGVKKLEGASFMAVIRKTAHSFSLFTFVLKMIFLHGTTATHTTLGRTTLDE
jgi:hypothetical protein